jgi:membrane peptidoglycan carboxypeptidase
VAGTTLPRETFRSDRDDDDHEGPSRWARRFRRLVKYALLAGSAAVLLGVGAFLIAYAVVPLPDAKSSALAQETTLYFNDGKTVLGSFGTNRTSVELAQVPVDVRNAVLAAEDRDFYSNRGVSPKGIARAFVNNVRGGGTQGASTITQQYVRNVHTNAFERSYTRKGKEFLYALKVDRQLTKDEILASYLNTIYWGPGIYGIESASEAYFGVPVEKLGVRQGAYLAGIIRSPGRYDPVKNRAAAEERWNFVLDAMVQQGTLDANDRAGMKFPKTVPFKQAGGLAGPRGYLMKAARDELVQQGFDEKDIDTGGLRVYTTFDKSRQAAAEVAVKEGFPTGKGGKPAEGVHAGLASVEPGTGAVLAMYGGSDYLTRGFNDATQAHKQAGSTFKVFTLAAALEEGLQLRESRWQGNEPITVRDEKGDLVKIGNAGDGQAGNYGRVSLLRALERSINTAFVDVTVEIKPETVREAIETAGIPSGPDNGLAAVPTVTLGTASVSPVELANAYATLASGGKRASAHVVEHVDGPKRQSYDADTRTEQAFPEDVVKQVTYAMNSVVENGTGKVAKGADRQAAVKTGTHGTRSGKTVSAWFAGFTPEMATAVNFYREDKNGHELTLNGVGGEAKFHGNSYPGRIWTAYTKAALEGAEQAPLNMDPGEGGSSGDSDTGDGQGQGQGQGQGGDGDQSDNGGSGGGGGGGGQNTTKPSPTVTTTGTGGATGSTSPSPNPSGTSPAPSSTATKTSPRPSPTCTRRNPRFCPPAPLGLPAG